jgi:hypothetical protein
MFWGQEGPGHAECRAASTADGLYQPASIRFLLTAPVRAEHTATRETHLMTPRGGPTPPQVIGETFVDFKLMVKPSRLLPSLDVASIPLFRTITNYLINQALKHTLRLPRGLLVPILDPEEPSVYFHLDTTGRIEGSLAIEVLGLAVPQGPRQVSFLPWHTTFLH